MKTIIEMAREAGLIVDANQSGFDSVEAFAALVRADERDRAMRENAYVLAEREACAKVCDRAVGDGHPDDMHSDGQWAALTLAAEIRARGNT